MTRLLKIPGIVDAHVHLRDPGAAYKEDFYSGTCSALAGGVVAIVDMPNNPIPTTSLKALNQKQKVAAKKCVCNFGFYFGANDKNYLAAKKNYRKVKGLKIYMDHTTGSLLIEDLEILESHFKIWPVGKPILVHAEDATVAKAIALAFAYKKWLHICHVSQACELELIRKAKDKGLKITCEVTPHHLFLTKDYEKELKGFALMRPSLKTKNDVKSLWWGLNHNLIDYIATDHAPHTIEEKKSANPPFGVPGLETLLPLLLTALSENKISLKKLINLTSRNPAAIYHVNIKDCWVEVDLQTKWIINNNRLKTKCGWSPFVGFKVKGKIIRVFISGKKVFEDGEVLVKKGFGKLII